MHGFYVEYLHSLTLKHPLSDTLTLTGQLASLRYKHCFSYCLAQLSCVGCYARGKINQSVTWKGETTCRALSVSSSDLGLVVPCRQEAQSGQSHVICRVPEEGQTVVHRSPCVGKGAVFG